MATTVTVNSSYAGGLAGELLVEAFKKSDTISKNLITVLPNNIGTGYLPKISYTADLQDYSCGFDPTGDVDYQDKEVILKKFKIDHELCKDEFHQTFQAQSAGLFGAKNEIPQSIQEGIVLAILENFGAKVDDFIWNGRGAYDGLKAQILADAAVNGIYEGVLTKTNVVDALELAYNAIPDAVVEADDLVIVGSPKLTRLYKQNLAAQGDNNTVGDKELDYLGIRMESVGGLTGDSFFIYRVKNAGFLTGLENDLNRVDVKDMDETDLSGTIRTKVVAEMGVGYSFGQEIVAHDIAFV